MILRQGEKLYLSLLLPFLCICFGFGNKVSRSRRLPSTRARLTLEPTRLATLLCASLPFCFFSKKKENLTARRNFNLPPPRLWLKLWVRLPVAARGRGGRPSPPGGLGRPHRQTPRTTRQRLFTLVFVCSRSQEVTEHALHKKNV